MKLLAQAIQNLELELKNTRLAVATFLGPMTLKLNHDLDILKMYLQTENEAARSSHSKYITRIEKVQNSSHGQGQTSNHF